MFATGVGTVTGSNFLLQAPNGANILIDCGLVQGEHVAMAVNREPFSYDPSSIQTLLVTHAHLDHVGRIPKLVKEGFHGTIYSTPQTRDLAELILNDAVGILAEEARHDGVTPLYVLEDVQQVFPLWKTVQYHEQLALAPDVSAVFKDAGHILGASMIEITIVGQNENNSENKKILFSGDLGNSPAPLLCDTEPLGDVDYLAIESTYGDRNHEPKEERLRKLEQVIKSTLGRGGTLIIPAFSVDRTQVILYELNNLMESGRIERVPVFVDSPMTIKATQIYKDNESLFNSHVREQIHRGDNIFSFPGLEYAVTQGDSRHAERLKGAKIILAGSGMSIGGRVISHEEYFLPDPRSTILLVGYQSVGSLGRELADGARKVRIHGREISIKAHIETLYGYSSHKDSDHLVEFVSTGTSRLKKVFVIMGEPGASMHLAQRLNNELDAHAIIPDKNVFYELN